MVSARAEAAATAALLCSSHAQVCHWHGCKAYWRGCCHASAHRPGPATPIPRPRSQWNRRIIGPCPLPGRRLGADDFGLSKPGGKRLRRGSRGVRAEVPSCRGCAAWKASAAQVWRRMVASVLGSHAADERRRRGQPLEEPAVRRHKFSRGCRAPLRGQQADAGLGVLRRTIPAPPSAACPSPLLLRCHARQTLPDQHQERGCDADRTRQPRPLEDDVLRPL